MDLMNDNKELNEELRGFNKKLSRMIDYKGFSKLLNRIKEGKPVEFRNRPKSTKIRTLNREIQNNEEVLKMKKVDLKRLLNKRKRLLDPIYLTDINRDIIDHERKIKQFKKDIHHIEIEVSLKYNSDLFRARKKENRSPSLTKILTRPRM